MKLIKWLLWLILFIVVVAVGGALFLANKVDPNDLKPQISQRVEAATGRKLELAGDLSWRFYPWIGITLNDFTLANRSGFSPDAMIKADQADIQLKLLPLLRKQIEIGKIDLKKPQINLSVNAQGETNWGDLVKENKPSTNNAGSAAGAVLGGFVIQGVNITDGDVDWSDQKAGQQYHLSGLNLTTGTVTPGKPIAFDLKTALQGTLIPKTANINLNGVLQVNEAFDDMMLDKLHAQLGSTFVNATTDIESIHFNVNDGQLQVNNVQATASNEEVEGDVNLKTLQFNINSGNLAVDSMDGEMLMDETSAKIDVSNLTYGLNSGLASAEKLAFAGQYELFPFKGNAQNVRFDVQKNILHVAKQSINAEFNQVPLVILSEQLQLNIKTETLQLPILNLQFGDAKVVGNVNATSILSNIQANGHLDSNQFNPRELVDGLGLNLLQDVPQNAMKTLQISSDFTGGENGVSLSELAMQLDDSTLSGQFSLQDFANPVYRFKLFLDQLNVDAYLNEENKATAEKAGPAAAIALPFASLKGLDVQGEIGVGKLKMQNLLSDDVLVKIDTSEDRVQIAPLKAKIYGGETVNKFVYDISGNTPKIEIDSKLTSLNIGPFLQAMQMTDRLEGFGNVNAKIGSIGLDADAMIANLSGDINIDLNDGAIRGANIQDSIIKAAGLYKQLKGKDLNLEASADDKTAFSNFSSHISVDKGVLKTNDISLKAPGLRITGGGKVDLNSEKLDIELEVAVVKTLLGQGGKAVNDLKGETIPLKITGTMSSVKILPDFAKILRRDLERKISKKYLGGQKLSGEGFKKTAKQKLNEKIAQKLGLNTNQNVSNNADKTKTEAGVTKSNAEKVNSAPKKPVDLEDQLKEKLKSKLMDKLFGG